MHAHRFYARDRFHAAHVGSRYRRQRSGIEAVEPVTRRRLGFAVERTLLPLDFRGCCYPVEKRFRLRPAISRSLAVSARIDPSAPPSLPAGFTLRRIITTTQDSDYSGGPHGLSGVTALDRGLRHRLAAGVLPAFPGRPSRPVALADPAEILCRRTTV
jgi:hypothetical protein